MDRRCRVYRPSGMDIGWGRVTVISILDQNSQLYSGAPLSMWTRFCAGPSPAIFQSAAGQIRSCHQSHHRDGARDRSATQTPRAGRRGDRMSRRMSAFGTKRTSCRAQLMSAFRGKADIVEYRYSRQKFLNLVDDARALFMGEALTGMVWAPTSAADARVCVRGRLGAAAKALGSRISWFAACSFSISRAI